MNGCIFWFFKLAAFFILPIFRDEILSTLCLLFVSQEEELYLLQMLVVISLILCRFSVLWNNVAVLQFIVSFPHCISKFVLFVCFLYISKFVLGA